MEKERKVFPVIERRFEGEDKESFYNDFYGQDADARQCAILAKIGLETADAMFISVVDTDNEFGNFKFSCEDAAFVMTIVMREVAMIANLGQKEKEHLVEDIHNMLSQTFRL